MHGKGLGYHFIQSEGNKLATLLQEVKEYINRNFKAIMNGSNLIKSFITNFLFNRLPQACLHVLTAELQSLGFSPPYKDCRFNSGSI